MNYLILFIFSLTSLSLSASLPEDKKLPILSLSGKDGGHLDGSAWNLSDNLIQNKVTVIFYVDPDEKDLNEEMSEILSKKNYPKDDVQYIAIINMAATWLPNFAIAASLEKKQKKYPDTLYLKDFTKKGVNTWGVDDDQNNFILLNRESKVIYSKFGKIDKKEQELVIKLLEAAIKEKKKASL